MTIDPNVVKQALAARKFRVGEVVQYGIDNTVFSFKLVDSEVLQVVSHDDGEKRWFLLSDDRTYGWDLSLINRGVHAAIAEANLPQLQRMLQETHDQYAVYYAQHGVHLEVQFKTLNVYPSGPNMPGYRLQYNGNAITVEELDTPWINNIFYGNPRTWGL